MHYLQLIGEFFKVSTQAEMAYRTNFFIRILNALLNLVTGVLSLTVVFNQAESIKGWELPSAMTLLGVYLLLIALRGLFISPSLESVASMDGEIWQGTFDFTLLRTVDKQFLVSFRHWRVLMLFDLALALGVLGFAIYLLEASLDFLTIIQFILTLAASVILLYSALLAFSALIFWNSGFLFTWLIIDLFQLARYPVGLYPSGVDDHHTRPVIIRDPLLGMVVNHPRICNGSLAGCILVIPPETQKIHQRVQLAVSHSTALSIRSLILF